MPYPERGIYKVLFSLITLLIILTNALVAYTYIRMKRKLKRKIPNILLLNQACVDLMQGLSTIAILIFFNKVPSKEEAQLKSFLLEYMVFLAIGVLWVGTAERLMSVKVPFHHHNQVTGIILSIAYLIPFNFRLPRISAPSNFPPFNFRPLGQKS